MPRAFIASSYSTGVNLDNLFRPAVPLGKGMEGNVPRARDDLDPGVSDELDEYLNVREDFADWIDDRNSGKNKRPYLVPPFGLARDS